MRDPGSRRGQENAGGEGFLFPFDSLWSKLHAIAFIRFRFVSLAAVIVAYSAAMLAAGDALGVSSNYFVILPVMVAALGFGAVGGTVAGALGLPANLLAYGILGHPEFSPASKLIAELSGIAVGLVFGRLADYFRVLEREIKRRIASEEALREALDDKKLLLRELHHRVKNNLNVMKSLVQLQRNRSSDPSFLRAADDLMGRIFALSLVHDQLNIEQEPAAVDPVPYIRALVGNLASGFGVGEKRIGMDLDEDGRLMPVDAAISLGLIVNEVLTNALKHGSPGTGDAPSIRLSFSVEGDEYCLEICDEGPGPGDNALSRGREKDQPIGERLGLKLVRSLALSLGGRASLVPIEGASGPAGARFDLVFPAQASPMKG